MIVFRHADPRFPFIWESETQPAGRWHGPGEGPAHYFADTPSGAWAELLRHEEITDPADLAGVRRALWAIDLPELPGVSPDLRDQVLTGDRTTYPACQAEARRLREAGSVGLRAPSAALTANGARGWRVDGGLRPGPPRDGEVYVLFGQRDDLIGWPVVLNGSPPGELLERVRHLI